MEAKTNWFKRNYKNIIRISYIIPILVAAGISIFHVISWYGITNPMSWAIYLSIGIEIAALSALAGMTAKMNKWVYVPFFIVTFIQLLGNIFASYSYIDVTGDGFKAWVELFNPMFESFGWVQNGDVMMHKRILGILGGVFIPLISLSFLHLLISFNDKEEKGKIEGATEGATEGAIDKDVWIPVKNVNTNISSEGPCEVRKFTIPVGNVSPETAKKSLEDLFLPETPIEEIKSGNPIVQQLEFDFDAVQEPIENKKDFNLVGTNNSVKIETLPEDKLKVIVNKREPVIPTGRVERKDIPEVNLNRGFSVKVPKSNNSIEKF